MKKMLRTSFQNYLRLSDLLRVLRPIFFSWSTPLPFPSISLFFLPFPGPFIIQGRLGEQEVTCWFSYSLLGREEDSVHLDKVTADDIRQESSFFLETIWIWDWVATIGEIRTSHKQRTLCKPRIEVIVHLGKCFSELWNEVLTFCFWENCHPNPAYDVILRKCSLRVQKKPLETLD